MFVSRKLLHVGDRVALIDDLPAQDCLDGVFKGDNAGGLAELKLNNAMLPSGVNSMVLPAEPSGLASCVAAPVPKSMVTRSSTPGSAQPYKTPSGEKERSIIAVSTP